MDTPADRTVTALFDKAHVTVLVTDSGLGGLAIFAQMAARLERDPLFANLSLVYYNAWPEQNRGYNRLGNMAERVRVFDRALEGMKRYKPDIIMIACNTLSVLYDQTQFSRRETIPVIDIVHFGVDLVYQALVANSSSAAVLLGTLTTIASGVHMERLTAKGIPQDRLTGQPCDQLATHIERGPYSGPVKQLVDQYMGEAAQKLSPVAADLHAALFCTHFGYCRDLIRTRLQHHSDRRVTVLDPNMAMADFLFATAGPRRCAQTNVSLQVVSRIVWEPAKIDAISDVIADQSPQTAQALINYDHNPELFTF
jgi:glutamate racemase